MATFPGVSDWSKRITISMSRLGLDNEWSVTVSLRKSFLYKNMSALPTTCRPHSDLRINYETNVHVDLRLGHRAIIVYFIHLLRSGSSPQSFSGPSSEWQNIDDGQRRVKAVCSLWGSWVGDSVAPYSIQIPRSGSNRHLKTKWMDQKLGRRC